MKDSEYLAKIVNTNVRIFLWESRADTWLPPFSWFARFMRNLVVREQSDFIEQQKQIRRMEGYEW